MIRLKKKDWQMLSQVLIVGALLAVVFSVIGYLGIDIWLASTQWLLVAGVLGIFGMYSRMS